VSPLTNIYGKISTIIVFYVPIFFQGRSTGAEVLIDLITREHEKSQAFLNS
jgi:hypothetical protein